MSGGWKRRAKIAGGSLIGIPLLLVVTLVIVLQTSWAKDEIRDYVLSTVNETLAGRLVIGEITGNLITGFRAHDVALYDGREKLLVRAPEVSADYDLFTLITGDLVIDDIRVRDPLVILRTYEDGAFNMVTLAGPPTPGEPVTVRLDFTDIALTNGQLVFQDDTMSPLRDGLDDADRSSVNRLFEELASDESSGGDVPGTYVARDLHVGGSMTLVTDGENLAVSLGEVGANVVSDGWVRKSRVAAKKATFDLEKVGMGITVSGLDVSNHLSAERIEFYDVPSDAEASTPFERAATVVDDFVLQPQLGERLLPSLSPQVPLRLDATAATDGPKATFDAEVRPEVVGDARLRVAGTIEDYASPAEMAYDLAVSSDGLRPHRYVDAGLPELLLNLDARLEGSGVDPETMEVSGRAWVESSDIDTYRIDAAYVEAAYRAGAIRLDALRFLTPYVKGTASGELSDSGDFATKLRVRSNDALAQVSQKVFKRDVDTRADIDLTANGRVDISARPGLEMMERLNLETNWHFREFSAEDITVARSRGDVSLELRPLEDGARRLRFDISASGKSIRARDFRLASFHVGAEGRTVMKPPIDLSTMLRTMNLKSELEVRGLSAPGVRLDRADVSGNVVSTAKNRFRWELRGTVDGFSTDGVNIDRTEADLAGSARLGEGTSFPGMLQAVEVRGDVDGREISFDDRGIGEVHVRIDVTGPVRDLTGAVDLRASDADFGRYNFATLDATLALEGDRRFRLDAKGTQKEGVPEDVDVVLHGRYSRNLTSYDIESIELQTVGDQTWDVSGGLSVNSAKGEFVFDDVTLEQGEQKVNLDGHFNLGRDQDLTFDVEKLKLAEVKRQFGLKELPDIEGELDARGRLSGTARHPTAKFEIEIRDFYYQGYGPFSVVAEGRYDEEKLRLSTLEVDAYTTRVLSAQATLPIDIGLEGTFDVLWEREFAINASIPRLNAEDFYRAVPLLKSYSVRGTLEADVSFDGRLEHPNIDLTASVKDGLAEPPSDGRDFKVGPIEARLAMKYRSPARGGGGLKLGGDVVFEGAKVVEMNLTTPVAVSEWIHGEAMGEEIPWAQRLLDMPIDATLRVSKFDLKQIRVAALHQADVEGTVEAKISATGKLGSPDADFEIHLGDFGWDRFRDIYVDLEGGIERNMVDVSKMRVEWDADEILRAHGRFPLPLDVMFGAAELGDLPIDLMVEVPSNRMAKLSAVDYEFSRVKGNVAGHVEVTGRLEDPSLKGRFSLVNTQMADRSLGTLALAVAAEKNRADVEVTVCRGKKKALVADASVPLELDIVKLASGTSPFREGEIDGRLKADDLKLAGLFPYRLLDDYVQELGGTLNASLAVDGTTDAPRVKGDVTIRDAAVFLPSIGRSFADGRVDIDFREERVGINEFYLSDGNGYVDAKATLQMESFDPGKLEGTLSAKDFGTSGLTPIPTYITVNLDLEGDFEPEVNSATVRVRDLEVKVPDTSGTNVSATSLHSDVIVLSSRRTRTLGEILDLERLAETTADVAKTRARVNVVIERDSWVRHPNGQVEVEGDITAEISTSSAILYGEIRTIRGTVEFLGKSFDVDKGVVTFTGANPPNPRLQLEAVYRLERSVTQEIGQPTSGEPRVIVVVSGSANDPRLKLRSDPSMPESDIVYVLATGRPPSAAGVGEDQSVANRALGAAGGLLAGMLQQKLSGVIPVDVVRVEAGEEGLRDSRIEVGWYLTNRVFLSVETGAEDGETTTRVNVEYRFAERWLLEVAAGNRADGSLDIFWDIY